MWDVLLISTDPSAEKIDPVFCIEIGKEICWVIPHIVKGFSFLGFQFTPDVVEYATVEGLLKMDEIFRWATMIIEFYFGAQLAKGK